jgi:hypothetical protein
MTMKRIGIIPALVLVFALAAGAQEASTERVKTVEELYFEDPLLGSLLDQATSINRESKLAALNDIEEMLDSGSLGDEDLVFDILELLSAEGVGRVVREANRLVNNYPIVRRRAAELIGRMGSELSEDMAKQAKITLTNVLLTDNEVMVKSEAAFAMGKINLQDDEDIAEVLSMLAYAIQIQTNVAPDNNFAYAVAMAVDNIATRAGGVKSYKAYSSLLTIREGNYTIKVKQKADEVLENLKEYR